MFRIGNSCTKYYECVIDKKLGPLCSNTFKCRYCLKFNANKGCCDMPYNVPECNYDNGLARSCTGPGLFPVPKEPKKYYECKKHNNDCKLTVKSCKHNEEFNSKNGKCSKPKMKEAICKHEGFIGNSYECNKYIYCRKHKHNNTFTEYEFSCPSGQLFFGHNNNCQFIPEEDICDCKTNQQIIG